jgi:hypothetical protein
MSEKVELFGGPLDGLLVREPRGLVDYRFPLPAPKPTAAQLKDTPVTSPIPLLVAVYRRPADPLDSRWQYAGQELL